MNTNTPRAAGFRNLEELRPMIVILTNVPAPRDGATRSR